MAVSPLEIAIRCVQQSPPIAIEVRDAEAVDAIVKKLDALAKEMIDLGGRGQTSGSRALSLAQALRTAGWALDFTDPDDDDIVLVALQRLEQLKRDADHLLTLWTDDEVTRPFYERAALARALSAEASILSEGEPTRVVMTARARGVA